MWHQRRRRRLGVKTDHRKALLRNLIQGLVLHRRIETTYVRAKEAARLADRMVTVARKGTLSARRHLLRDLGSPEIARCFIEEIAPAFGDRRGGYTRVLKTRNRRGDGTPLALLEFSVPMEKPEKKKPKKEKKLKPAPPKAKAEKKAREEKKEAKPEKEKREKPVEKVEKEEAEKRGGFLSKLRKFLTGE